MCERGKDQKMLQQAWEICDEEELGTIRRET